MYKIAKQFDFCYGHRVWSQTLNSEYSLDSCLKCRHLHGHQGTIMIYLEAEELTDGMVTDFKHLNWFKKWLDDTLDHKFIIDREDPLFTTLLPHYPKFSGVMDSRYYNFDILGKCWFPKLLPQEFFTTSPSQQEMYEGFVIVDFVPTSENLSKWIFDIVQEKMKPLGIKVSQVQYYETPKSQSNYYG
jgi:6-pyruvoyltetrahydropterin/6-carboxytetrahydropterin synthase